MKNFINDFYTYDFTGIIYNYDSSNESNNENESDLELTEKEDDKEEVQSSAPVTDDEVTSKLLHQDTAYITIDND